MNFYCLFRNQLRCMSSKTKPKSHYDTLGITSTSTQSEIKAAYYKLSKLHHPDRTQGSPDSFRDISEAYEILGNVKSRKLYDKGLLIRHPPVYDETTAATDRFHRSREMRSRPPPPSGSTPIYDFDEWSKAHYGATFKQQVENRRRENEYKKSRRQEIDNVKAERVTFMLMLFFAISMILMRDNNYDKTRPIKQD